MAVKQAPKSRVKERIESGGSAGSSIVLPVVGSSAKLVVYPFPVRPDVFAELKLPADLTIDEALRLGAFLKALALSDATSGPE